MAAVGIFWIGVATCFAEWPFGSPSPGASATPFAGFGDEAKSGNADVALVEKPFDQLSNQKLDDTGRKALAIRPQAWKHAETENFVLHYRRLTDATRVAREVEYDLKFVAATLGATKQQYAGKSHVFIFQDANEWRTFNSKTDEVQWAVSFADGDNLYLNVRDSGGGGPFDSTNVAYTATEVIESRLYPNKDWPPWLDSGFAGYMAGASIAARKNEPVEREEKNLRNAVMPLDEMQKATDYLKDLAQERQLSETAEKVVRFLMTELPKERMSKFIDDVLKGRSLKDALLDVYPDKLASYDDFEKKYEQFGK